MSRSLKKGPFVDERLLQKVKKLGPDSKEIIKTWKRSCTIVPEMIGFSFGVHNGKNFITVKIEDKNKLLVPKSNNQLYFSIEGPGKIVATDNGDATSHESFQADRRKAFNGLCLAIVRASGKPGKIRLVARAAGLKEASIEIEVKSSSIAVSALP